MYQRQIEAWGAKNVPTVMWIVSNRAGFSAQSLTRPRAHSPSEAIHNATSVNKGTSCTTGGAQGRLWHTRSVRTLGQPRSGAPAEPQGLGSESSAFQQRWSAHRGKHLGPGFARHGTCFLSAWQWPWGVFRWPGGRAEQPLIRPCMSISGASLCARPCSGDWALGEQSVVRTQGLCWTRERGALGNPTWSYMLLQGAQLGGGMVSLPDPGCAVYINSYLLK